MTLFATFCIVVAILASLLLIDSLAYGYVSGKYRCDEMAVTGSVLLQGGVI